MGYWDLWNFGASAAALFARAAPPTGTEQLDAVCPAIRLAWIRRGLHVLIVGGAWGRQTATNPAWWNTLAAIGTNPYVAGVLLFLTVSTHGVRFVWPWAPLVAALVVGTGLAMGILLRALGERVVFKASRRTTYVELKCALFAPPAYRAAWWRRLCRTLGESHEFVGYILERHATDGGIPGLTTDELLPMLESNHPATRLAAVAAMAQTVPVARAAPVRSAPADSTVTT